MDTGLSGLAVLSSGRSSAVASNPPASCWYLPLAPSPKNGCAPPPRPEEILWPIRTGEVAEGPQEDSTKSSAKAFSRVAERNGCSTSPCCSPVPYFFEEKNYLKYI